MFNHVKWVLLNFVIVVTWAEGLIPSYHHQFKTKVCQFSSVELWRAVLPPRQMRDAPRKPTALADGSWSYNDDWIDDSSSDSDEEKTGELINAWDQKYLTERIRRIRLDMIMKRDIMEKQKPPNPKLVAQDFVSEILKALQRPHDPLPDSGFRVLLRSSTSHWRRELRKSVGAPLHASDEIVASALGSAMERPNNQFGILCSTDNNNQSSSGDEEEEDNNVIWSFDMEPVDFQDGNCWLECRLRSEKDYSLLVVMGWQLRRRPEDGAWLVDGIDWQDFRDSYRPGIGREEWMRICG